jgi:hypothetical protein
MIEFAWTWTSAAIGVAVVAMGIVIGKAAYEFIALPLLQYFFADKPEVAESRVR